MTLRGKSTICALTMCILGPSLVALALVVSISVSAVAQQYPQTNPTKPTIPSQAQSLEGRLVFHDGIRQWFELKLDEPQFGQNSIQVVRGEGDWTPIEVLRGCRVRSRGALGFASTGYYSLDVYQSVDAIEPVGPCARKAPLPNYSKAKPAKSVREYRVDMYVNYRPGDHPIMFRVSSAGKSLRPWQAYARYSLTGGFVLYGHCAAGFAVDRVFGTPEAKPTHVDMAMFDPETAAAAGKKDLHLGFTCVREQ